MFLACLSLVVICIALVKKKHSFVLISLLAIIFYLVKESSLLAELYECGVLLCVASIAEEVILVCTILVVKHFMLRRITDNDKY